MTKWKILFSIKFLRSSYKEWLKHLFQIIGFLWLLIELVTFFSPTIKSFIQEHLFALFGLSIIYAFYKIFPKISKYYKFKDTDVELGFAIQDLFKINGDKVIPSNTNFEMKTEKDSGAMDSNSLQGQMRHKYYSDDIQRLKDDVSKALKEENILNPEIGSIIKITPKNETIYLIALTELNDKGVVKNSSFTNVEKCLMKLWQYIGEKGNYNHIVIPLIGSGRARINKNRLDIAKEIVRSFVPSIIEKKFCEKLTICIFPSDYKKHKIDIEELREFIEYKCKFTEFSESSAKSIGTPLK